MPAENLDPGASPGLFSSLRSFWGVLIAILYTRLDLATVELEELGIHAIQFVMVVLAAMLCLGATVFFGMFLILALFWDTEYRLLVLGLIFGVYLIATLAFAFVARSLVVNRPKFLGQTLAELRRDVESLRTKAAAVEETKP